MICITIGVIFGLVVILPFLYAGYVTNDERITNERIIISTILYRFCPSFTFSKFTLLQLPGIRYYTQLSS